MRRIVGWAVRNSPAMNTVMIALIVIGVMAAYFLRREVFPEFDLDRVIVTVVYPGASPTEVEQGICQKVEEAIRSVDGIKKILSVSTEGAGYVTATLHNHVSDSQRVVNDVRSAVDRIPSFPERAEKPDVQAVIGRFPAIQVAVVGPDKGRDAESEWRLREQAEAVRQDLLELPSVSQVLMLADRPFQIDVEIPEATLRKYNLSLSEVASAIRRENVEIPAGLIRTTTSEYLLRGANRHLVGHEIAKLPIVTTTDGVVLTVDDLGTVVDGFEDVSRYSYMNTLPTISLQVNKSSDEDLLQIVEEVRAYIEKKQAEMPEGYSLVPWFDTSFEVRDRLNLLTRSGLFGLLLVFIALSLFLDIRLAFWVALGIPVSLLGTCAVLYSQGHTLNMLSMFAFVMALGIVVDDAIVIGENIFSHRQMGKSRIRASIDGTVEVAPAVTASVMTTVVAFVPMFFVSGLMGKFMAIIPVAIISMLLISLFESIFILPCHLGHTNLTPGSSPYSRMRKQIDRLIAHVVNSYYVPVLHWLLRRPMTAYAISVSSLLLVAGLILGHFTPFVMMPQVDGDLIVCHLAFPAGTVATATDEATKRIEEAIQSLGQEYEDAGKPFLNNVFRSVGGGFAGDPTQLADNGSHLAFMLVELKPASDRPYISSSEVTELWRSRVGQIPGLERIAFEGAQIGPGGKPIEFKLLGDDMDVLEAAVEETKKKLASYQGVYDVADGSETGKWEVQLRVRPEAEALGINNETLASTVRAAYYGEEVMRLQRGRHEVKLMVRYPEEDRRSLSQFEEIRVHTPRGQEIPLPELAHRELRRAYSQIVRVDQERAITITSNLNDKIANAREIVEDLKANYIPGLQEEYPGIDVRWEGQQEQSEESLNSLLIGFIVAVFGIYLLLTIQFGSFLQPAIIIAVIPFGMVGAVLGHLLLQLPLTFFTMFGIVALSGVVVNDSIVLIDFINRRRTEEPDLQLALIQSGRDRFRPVLLTSITTVLGLLPILLERSFQAQLLIPMAAALSFGLAMATVWILMLVPVLYQSYVQIVDAFTGQSEAVSEDYVDPSEEDFDPEHRDLAYQVEPWWQEPVGSEDPHSLRAPDA
jgi:multidrug efflux pump subunit AcrB